MTVHRYVDVSREDRLHSGRFWGEGHGDWSPLWIEGIASENVTLEARQGLARFDSLAETRKVLEGLGEAWSVSTVWRLRRRIRRKVGDEIGSDRWSIYSSEKFWEPSQIDTEAGCAEHREAAAGCNCCEIRDGNKLGVMCLMYSAALLICTRRRSHSMIVVVPGPLSALTVCPACHAPLCLRSLRILAWMSEKLSAAITRVIGK